MVENLLSITRIQDGNIPLKKHEEMLEEVAGDAILTTRRRFPDCHVELDLSEDILYFPMEPMLVKQVMVNLLENAIRHSGDTQHITLHLFRQDDWAVVEVRDRGKGLSPEICQAVQAASSWTKSSPATPLGVWASACPSVKASQGPRRLLRRRAITRRAGRCSASVSLWRKRTMPEKRAILVIEDDHAHQQLYLPRPHRQRL